MRKHMMLKWDEGTPEPLPMNQAVNAGRFDGDPFKAIREVYKAWKPMVDGFKGSDLKLVGFPFITGFLVLWIAISETIKIVGEEEK